MEAAPSILTVAILAQGTSWAVADMQAFLVSGFNIGIRKVTRIDAFAV